MLHTPPLLTVKGLRLGPDFPTPRGALAESPTLAVGAEEGRGRPGGLIFQRVLGWEEAVNIKFKARFVGIINEHVLL